MKKFFFVLVFVLLFAVDNSRACRCQWAGPFVDVALGCPLVAVVTIESYYIDSTAFQTFPLAAYAEIRHIIKGEPAQKRIRIWGDDGKSCRPYISAFDTSSVWVMALYEASDTRTEYYISICGAYYLSVRQDTVTGHIHDVNYDEPLQKMALDDFLHYVSNVLTLSDNPLHDMISPVLQQNYPNPFNPVTKINYQLSMTSDVDLSIYNVLGQKIATLVNKEQAAGCYSVQWNAAGFSNGVYIYTLETDTGFKQNRKLILMK